ncbi:MAG: glycoside-pentoside-hexuronide (GPH):cation symporter, partial [Eubacteriales bacterium]|nr:glycoside-pentoside-hexuronide (GPH):cation symporter [Eubacteriales bacterium]
MEQSKQLRPFGIRDKIGYLFGDFGNDFTFILSTVILMKFYTDVVGLSAGVIGTIMMVTRFVDAFTDVTMGRICDRSRGKAGVGKFRPWLLRMCVPVAVSSFLLYQTGVAAFSPGMKIAYLTATYILWSSVFYTAINIPYGSMASAISPDPGDRQSLSAYRSIGATLAGAIIGVLLPIAAYQKIDGVETIIGPRVTVLAGVFSVLAVICYLLCYALTRERVTPSAEPVRQSSTLGMLMSAVRNRALISIIAASVVMLLAQLTMQNMTGYVYPDYYNNATAQSVSTLLMVAGMLIAAALAKPLAARFGKVEISVVSNLFAAVVCVITFFVRPQSVWVFTALQGLNWLGLGVFTVVSWALITDVIDYAEIKNGVREDGSVYALYSFARKLGQAFAAGLSGWLLTLIGYMPGAVGGQTPQVLGGIFAIATLVPALGFALLALVLWFWYPLHKRQVEENVAILKEKHAAGQAAD